MYRKVVSRLDDVWFGLGKLPRQEDTASLRLPDRGDRDVLVMSFYSYPLHYAFIIPVHNFSPKVF